MKRFLSHLLFLSILLVTGFVFAANKTSTMTTTPSTPNTTSTTTTTPSTTVNTQQLNGAWTCTTNASSATSGSTEEQADKDMANNAKPGTDAFKFAMQNCRDCTKISCYISNQGTTTQSANTPESTTTSTY